MKYRHIFFGIFLSISLLLGSLFWKLGFFKPIDIKIEEKGPYTLLFKEHQGAYHKIVPILEEIETWAKLQGLPCALTFGDYKDNPDQVEELRLRSRGGCLWESNDTEALAKLESLKANLPTGFKVDSLTSKKYITASFEGAPSLGPIKIYPKVDEYANENKLQRNEAILEVYQVLSEKAVSTLYLFEVKNEAVR